MVDASAKALLDAWSDSVGASAIVLCAVGAWAAFASVALAVVLSVGAAVPTDEVAPVVGGPVSSTACSRESTPADDTSMGPTISVALNVRLKSSCLGSPYC